MSVLSKKYFEAFCQLICVLGSWGCSYSNPFLTSLIHASSLTILSAWLLMLVRMYMHVLLFFAVFLIPYTNVCMVNSQFYHFSLFWDLICLFYFHLNYYHLSCAHVYFIVSICLFYFHIQSYYLSHAHAPCMFVIVWLTNVCTVRFVDFF